MKTEKKDLTLKQVSQSYSLFWAAELVGKDPECKDWSREDKLDFVYQLGKGLWLDCYQNYRGLRREKKLQKSKQHAAAETASLPQKQ